MTLWNIRAIDAEVVWSRIVIETMNYMRLIVTHYLFYNILLKFDNFSGNILSLTSTYVLSYGWYFASLSITVTIEISGKKE